MGPMVKYSSVQSTIPGSWADGAVTRNFLPFLRGKIGQYKIVVDQGFPRSGDAYGVLVGPLTKKGARKLHASVRAEMIRRSNIYVSLCQASEWGMRALQGSFPRFKKSPSFKQRKKGEGHPYSCSCSQLSHPPWSVEIKSRLYLIQSMKDLWQLKDTIKSINTTFQEGDYVSDSDDLTWSEDAE